MYVYIDTDTCRSYTLRDDLQTKKDKQSVIFAECFQFLGLVIVVGLFLAQFSPARPVPTLGPPQSR